MKYSRFKPSKIFIRMSMLGNKAIDPPMPMNSEEIVLTCGKHLSSKEAEAWKKDKYIFKNKNGNNFDTKSIPHPPSMG
jgi:hypothetical protein